MIPKTARVVACIVLVAGSSAWSQVSIAASSEFRPAIEEIRKAFQDQTGIPTRAVYGSSGAMAHHAKAIGTDIFLSSDKNWADSLAATPRAVDKPLVLGAQPVCVWVRGSVIDPSSELDHLVEKNNGEIVIADSSLSPDAVAVVKALRNLPNWPSIRSRLVVLVDPGAVVDSLASHKAPPAEPTVKDPDPADSVGKDSSKTASDSGKPKSAAKKSRTLANGFLPQPMLWNSPIAGIGRWIPVDASIIAPLRATALRLKSVNAPRSDAAKSFMDFLQSPKARAILRAKGFLPPP